MYSCVDCGHLDKTRRIEASNGISYRYGCHSDRYTCGWIIKGKSEKSELDSMGCSYWEDGNVKSKEQLTIDDWLATS